MREPDSHSVSATRAVSESSARPDSKGSAESSRGRAIVVGASSGMGSALVRQLASDGWTVAALARRGAALEELAQSCGEASGAVLVRVHDVHDTDAIPALFEELVRALGGLDLIIYAAGVMPLVGEQEYSTEKDLEMLAVNTAGCIAWLNPAAELFLSQRSGTIVGISSIAGDRGRRGNPVYGTTKAALNHYLEALRNRLSTSGVRVCTIRPGFVDTVMTKGMEGLFWLISPEEAARQILAAARRGSNVRYVPFRWALVGLVIRNIPSFLFRRMNV